MHPKMSMTIMPRHWNPFRRLDPKYLLTTQWIKERVHKVRMERGIENIRICLVLSSMYTLVFSWVTFQGVLFLSSVRIVSGELPCS